MSTPTVRKPLGYVSTLLICLALSAHSYGGVITAASLVPGGSVSVNPIVISSPDLNNDNVTSGPASNLLMIIGTFVDDGPIDIGFNFDVLDTGGITEYDVHLTLINDGSLPGFSFNSLALSLDGVPNDGLDFDFDEPTGTVPPEPATTTAPGVVSVLGEKLLTYTGPQGIDVESYSFHLDVPDGIDEFEVNVVPEAASGVLALLGLLSFAFHRRSFISRVFLA